MIKRWIRRCGLSECGTPMIRPYATIHMSETQILDLCSEHCWDRLKQLLRENRELAS